MAKSKAKRKRTPYPIDSFQETGGHLHWRQND
jgi:hypothetical protein